MQKCPLCQHISKENKIIGPDQRKFLFCEKCYLVFVHADFLPSALNEKGRYLQHQNSIEDKAYVEFLNQAIQPALSFLEKENTGLDFGCGPVPVLSQLLGKLDLNCAYYDPFFFPQLDDTKHYDFVFATECLEHFFSPAKEIQRITNFINPGGILTIMTEQWRELTQFATWSYARDATHVSFFHANTINLIASIYGLKILHTDERRVVVFRKNERASQ